MARIAKAFLVVSLMVLSGSVAANPDESRMLTRRFGPMEIRCDPFFGKIKTEMGKRIPLSQSNPSDIGDPLPNHWIIAFERRLPMPSLEKGPRYLMAPACSLLVFPLFDSAAPSFEKEFPTLMANVKLLRQCLKNRPKGLPSKTEQLPDFPFHNSAPIFIGRMQYLDFKSGSGILFLTQYSQEIPEANPINNEELACGFYGITSNSRYFITAEFPLQHPSLPKGILFTQHIARDKDQNYIRQTEKSLEAQPDDSFVPSLAKIKALLSSMKFE